MRLRAAITGAVLTALFLPCVAQAQANARLAILQAEDRRAPSAGDLATLRAGARSGDWQTARMAVRALGRLERPALIPDILPSLRNAEAAVRAEAANAAAQAAEGWRAGSAPSATALGALQSALVSRLRVEADPSVRAALCESIARLKYTSASEIEKAETALIDFATGVAATANADRLGIAKGLEALVRLHRKTRPPGDAAVRELRSLAQRAPDRTEQELTRDARVRRLALEALIAIDAADLATVESAAADPDPQVRRLAVRAAVIDGGDAVVSRGLRDAAPMVRIEALRAMRSRNATEACASSLASTSDPDLAVTLVGIDQLGVCGASPEVVSYLTRAVAEPDDAEMTRNWHRTAHALVALASAAPDAASAAVTPYLAAKTWQLRMYAGRAAAVLRLRDALERLAADTNENVAETAIVALSSVAGHDADRTYVGALDRAGYQVVRAAALALDRTPSTDVATPALRQALERAEDDGRPGAADARAAIRSTLASIGVTVKAPKPGVLPAAPLNANDLRRLASPRARFTIRDVGVFDVALFTLEAPATVLRFAQLASSGYYKGLTFHRVVPNGIIQGGSPGANEYASDAPYMRDEVGLWPHVRGAVGISTRGRDTGDAQFFIDLVDNPRYDHTYTVFAQVLNGMDVVDRIAEGDVIESVEILP